MPLYTSLKIPFTAEFFRDISKFVRLFLSGLKGGRSYLLEVARRPMKLGRLSDENRASSVDAAATSRQTRLRIRNRSFPGLGVVPRSARELRDFLSRWPATLARVGRFCAKITRAAEPLPRRRVVALPREGTTNRGY